jgi:LmbE family N-acetylglucosaminyl deacetylase
MKSAYDTIYLSPHLDDVALSCGGQVYMLGEAERPVLIVTVMGGEPPGLATSKYAQVLHDRWQLQIDVVARRRAEDIRACQILGADHLYWDIPDCIYRSHNETGDSLYISDRDIFDEVHPSEAELANVLSSRIQGLPAHDRLIVPLGVGNHVDHQITRQAAEQAGSSRLIYYEDYPYAADPGALDAVTQTDCASWQATMIPLSEAAIMTKIEAIAAFESQLSTFYQDRADMESAVRQYHRSIGGERVWRRVESR